MSRYIATTVILAATIFLLIFSNIYIGRQCTELNKLAEETEYFLEEKEFEKAEAALFEINSLLKEKKNTIMMLIDHETAEKLSSKLNRTMSFVKSKEKSLALAELTEARDMIDNIRNSQKISAENVL